MIIKQMLEKIHVIWKLSSKYSVKMFTKNAHDGTSEIQPIIAYSSQLKGEVIGVKSQDFGDNTGDKSSSSKLERQTKWAQILW